MEERKLRGILSKFNSIKERAEILQQRIWNLENYLSGFANDYFSYHGKIEDAKNRIKKVQIEIKTLIEYFNLDNQETSDALGIKIKTIIEDGNESLLSQLISECDMVIGALENDAVLLSDSEKNKLDDLKKEANDICQKLDIHIGRNIEESLIELEKGHYLASALITSRVIDYVLKHTQGDAVEDKIEYLNQINVFDKEHKLRQQQTEKISRLTRNLYNHRIDIYPTSSESLSLISDSLFLLKIYTSIEKKSV
jgi:hypothetical protein